MSLKYVFEGREQLVQSLRERYEERYGSPYLVAELCVGIWHDYSFLHQAWVVRVGDLEKIVVASKTKGFEGVHSLEGILDVSQNKRFLFIRFTAIQLGGFVMDLQWSYLPQGRSNIVSCSAQMVAELSHHMYLPEDILAYGVYTEAGSARN